MIEKNKCSVQFKYQCKDIIYENVGIVGCLDILKNWDINNPVFLSYNKDEKIFASGQILLPKEQKIEYKYVFHHKNEKIWENLPYNENRKLEIKEISPLIILDKEEDSNSIKIIVPKTNPKPVLKSSLKSKNSKVRKKSENKEDEPEEEKEEQNLPEKKNKKKKKKKKD